MPDREVLHRGGASVKPSVSVIATSYNQLATLRFLLASLERQSYLDFECLIADDGSSDGTAEYCAAFARGARTGGATPKFPLRFITQPDVGYRKSKIVNATIREATGQYILFLDSDVILHPDFVADHLGLRKPGAFVCGRRVELGPKLSGTVTLEQVRDGRFDRPNLGLLRSALTGDTQSVKRALRVPLEAARGALGYHRDLDILGSNFSAWKADLLAVNGFNEALEAYWGEDGDLFIRLRNTGRRAISALGLCVQYHVFHKRRVPDPAMVEKYARLLNDRDYKWAEKGVT